MVQAIKTGYGSSDFHRITPLHASLRLCAKDREIKFTKSCGLSDNEGIKETLALCQIWVVHRMLTSVVTDVIPMSIWVLAPSTIACSSSALAIMVGTVGNCSLMDLVLSQIIIVTIT